MRSAGLTAVIAMLLMRISFACADEEMRTWTDSTGKFKIEARFVSLEKQIVTLEKADGTRVQIDLLKLTQDDQHEAGRLQRVQQFRALNKNPFKEMGKPGTERLAPLIATPIDWTGVKRLEVSEGPWKPPALESVERKLDFTPKPITFPRNDIFAEVTGMVVHAKSRRAYVVTSTSQPGLRNATSSTFHVCDLEKGKVIKMVDAAGKQKPLAISPDGQWLITREDRRGLAQALNARGQMLTLWNVSDAAITATQRWDAAMDATEHSNYVNGASFLHDGTLLTWLGNGLFTWWDLKPLKARQTMQLEVNFNPAFSPDTRLMAALWYKKPDKPKRPAGQPAPPQALTPGHYNNLVLIDTATGQTLSSLRLEYTHLTHLAFSPDGKRLAALQNFNAIVYDFKTGQQETKLHFSGLANDHCGCFWTSPTALMTSNPVCFLAPEFHANIWTYHMHVKDHVTFAEDHVFFLNDMDDIKLVGVKLPHPEALQMVDKVKKDPQFFVVKPGTKVKIDLRGFVPGKLKDDVTAALVKSVKAAGLEVGEGGVSLLAWYSAQGEQEMFYTQEPEAPYRETSKINLKNWMYQMRIESEGRVHWSMVGISPAPPLLHLKRGEKIADYVKRLSEPEATFYQRTVIPRYLIREVKTQEVGSVSLGRSKVTAEGVR